MTRAVRIRAELRAQVFEIVERAAIRAEELVATHGGRSGARGVTIVVIDFVDFDLFSAFQAAGLIRRCAVTGAWELVRTWGGAEDDVELAEAMGATFATVVGKEFGDGLRIRVVSMFDRS